MRMRRCPRWSLVACAALLVALAVAIPVASSQSRPIAAEVSSTQIRIRDVLRGNGIGSVRFGASPHVVRTEIDSLLGQSGIGHQSAGDCGIDHTIQWWDQPTANGEPELTVYFSHSAFAGYQFGDLSRPRHQSGGWALATGRGLRLGEKLARGRKLYGHAFKLSSAQGGTWHLRTLRGRLDGYAWGTPSYGDVSWHSLVETIDAGEVGCPALSP